MFGLDFLFLSALWALPIAGLPVLLHLLFRRKSPVVMFSTLRFIKSSLQHTAARRRVQRWLLLAVRVLLLALLVWAIAQPVRILASGWFSPSTSATAAIVVDTSYSMQLRQQEVTLLDKADGIVGDLLRGPLKDAKVALVQSADAPDGSPLTLEPAAKLQGQWSALKSQSARVPLSARVTAAIDLLSRQESATRWLVIISDLQAREFPTALPKVDGTRLIVFDLHPDEPRSAGVTAVKLEPEQPIPGIGAQAVVEIAGRLGDARAAALNITRLDGTVLKSSPTLMAAFDTGGRTRLRVPLPEGLGVERWQLLTAKLQADDAMQWDNTRSLLVELPPRQNVLFVESLQQPRASAFTRLALDPWEGKVPGWPLSVRSGTTPAPDDRAMLVMLSQWPSAAQASSWIALARNGASVVLLLQPGLETSWEALSPPAKSALGQLLPAPLAPAIAGGGSAGASGAYRPAAPAQPDRILEGLADPSFRIDQMTVRRFVPFAAPTEPAVATLLHLSPVKSDSRAAPFGLLYRRTLGLGNVYTLATMPDSRYVSPPTHPLLLPLLVGMALRPPEQRDAQNVEIGMPLSLAAARIAGGVELELETPSHARYRVKPDASARYVYSATSEPGLYFWRRPGDPSPLAIANVQLPAAESDLAYRAAASLVPPGPDVLVVHSFEELQASVAKLAEPEPHWSTPIAIVLLLLCFEAMLASVPGAWKPIAWPWSLAKAGAP